MPNSNIDNSSSRQKSIFAWLKTSKYSRPLKENKGFYICGGKIVRLKSGERIDLLDWLKREGFISLKRVDDYSISYTPPNEQYQEKITFFDSRVHSEKYYEAIKKKAEFEESCRPDPYYSEGSSIVDNWLQHNKPLEDDDYDEGKEESYWEHNHIPESDDFYNNDDYGDYSQHQEYVRGHLDD